MSIYGASNLYSSNKVSNDTLLFEKYIDTMFLEDVLNEAAKFNLKKELKELSKKENPTSEDAVKIIKEIKKRAKDAEITPEEYEKMLRDLNISIGSIMMEYVGYGVVVAGDALPSLPVVGIGFAIVSVGFLSMLFAALEVDKIDGKQIKLENDAVKLYKTVLKAEAKAKKSLDKAEKLDDKAEVSRLEKVIKVLEKVKETQKTVLYKSKQDKKDKEKFTMNESATFGDIVVEEEVDYLLEFQGNSVKNNIFIQVLDDVDKMLKTRADIIDTLEDSADKVLKMTKTVNAKNIRDNIEKVHQIDKATAKQINDIEGYYPNLTMRFIRSEVSKFNNKYSAVGMDEKKKLAKKLEVYKKKMQDFGYKYEEESQIQKEWIKAIERMQDDDIIGAYELAKYAQNWYREIIKYVNESIEIINKIEKLLNIEKGQKSLVFKVLNIGYKKKSKEAANESYLDDEFDNLLESLEFEY